MKADNEKKILHLLREILQFGSYFSCVQKYYYSQQLMRFLLLYGEDVYNGKNVNFDFLRKKKSPCTESGLSQQEMKQLIEAYPDCLDKEKLIQTKEWKLYEIFFRKKKYNFEERYKLALDVNIGFTLRQIKKYKMLGILRCTGFSRLAFNCLRKNGIKVLYISTALLSDIEYAYTKEGSPMKNVERINAHREVAIYDDEEKAYKIIIISSSLKNRKKIVFAQDELGNDFVLKYPLSQNVGRKIYFPFIGNHAFIITSNGVSLNPPQDFTTLQRNNFLMSGNLNSNICPKKYW